MKLCTLLFIFLLFEPASTEALLGVAVEPSESSNDTETPDDEAPASTNATPEGEPEASATEELSPVPEETGGVAVDSDEDVPLAESETAVEEEQLQTEDKVENQSAEEESEPVQAEEESEPVQAEEESEPVQAEEESEPVQAEEESEPVQAEEESEPVQAEEESEPVQAGPLVDLFGPALLSLEMLNETHANMKHHYTNDALQGKKVIGVYFSADWCGPCRKFTPELVTFYEKMNSRRGRKDQFEIIWVSRCRDMNGFAQYFTHMGNWYALPPQEAMGERGQMLSNMYKVQSIPTLVLLDDLGNVITKDGRNMIPKDRAGVGFPWENPLSRLIKMIFPRSIRMLVKSQVATVRGKLFQRLKRILGLQRRSLS